MKKFFTIAMLGLASLSASAIGPDIFNKLGVGVGVGTGGVSFEAATPITPFVQMRAGVTWMPGVSFNADADFHYWAPDYREGTVELNGDLGRVQGQVIFNVYPVPKVPFYVAAGAYFGGNKLLKITGHSEELRKAGAVTIGDVEIPANENGDISGALKVNGFRPYLGIGWGRMIPGKIVNFSAEIGVQFEGKPKVVSDYGEVDLSAIEDDNTFQKIQNALKVYPTLTLRLNFRVI
ncbi:MAG: hypothetical protein C7K11_09245 [Candidatus Amulumruptor caecigallinarius]|uniref:Uncharacterized protein n=1 Tax=Candidatus Amulumruptor caecigallinarius TaxID=2109911 RepID=A0A4Q0U6W7_9BACT|nr:MAG: hypothetical protein C7K11_09245 [Candidatus Amulumruptor caecigallinarius]HJE38196.1 hypothetical protein [Candidatus Amulumruptor caecigallinarius]